MWVFMSDAFLSIVAPAAASPTLLVRARIEGDIERVFPRARVFLTPASDYRFRALVDRSVVAKALADEADDIDYTNFKDSVEEDDRHDAYLSVWGTMHQAQQQREYADEQ